MSILICCDARDCRNWIEIDRPHNIDFQVKYERWAVDYGDKQTSDKYYCPEHKEGKL